MGTKEKLPEQRLAGQERRPMAALFWSPYDWVEGVQSVRLTTVLPMRPP